jgi:DNA-damage-inducible protein D
MVEIGSKTKRKIKDYKLSRYACYLIVLNSDPRKKIISLGKSYFAFQTRKMEILEMDYESLNDDEKRYYQRRLSKVFNYQLNQQAKESGVKNYDKFHNAGYKGLYNGETADDTAKRKGLRYREDILDNMGLAELSMNIFRISQTEETLRNKNIKGEKNANDCHYKVGKSIRNLVKDLGGTMPEELPTPEKSLKEILKSKEFDKYIK